MAIIFQMDLNLRYLDIFFFVIIDLIKICMLRLFGIFKNSLYFAESAELLGPLAKSKVSV